MRKCGMNGIKVEISIREASYRLGWQTSGTVRVCRLAFNLWNGYTDPEHSNAYSPEDLFCCEFAPYFMEGVKIRYPKYCRELPPVRKQAEPAR